ncbi:hypothetical protein PQH03_20440 [Ralstonia insidiosa]|jgi:hypothetical protein|nr:hypothetical protein [Ralstonia insidiosa]KMW44347.1 hypothetical protein AC240_25875 [Ralstonia sp. MD27]MBX3771532.1 hypothetical protein [Ralstonia pickettii]NOZ17470.1 hypothetical protein [Betaproteobacteria bacterium]MBA9858508.1 hypothetical protein [Ralstonia insidiosa]MBA9871835.1 hypothetical protein [Ralstonia insidiosa]
MTFSLLALLTEQSPVISNESLADELKAYFENEEDFSLKFERLPFAKTDTLALRWGNWLMRVAYEEGSRIQDESAQIQEILGKRSPRELSGIDRRVRVVFADDNDREYTNQIVDMMQFLQDIEGSIVFDPQKNDLME